MKFLADIEVEEGLKDSDGDLGTAGQVLSSTSTGTNWIDAAGTIGGSITDNQVAVGAATANTIEGSSGFTWDGSLLDVDGDAQLDSTLRFISTKNKIFVDQDNGSGFDFYLNNIRVGDLNRVATSAGQWLIYQFSSGNNAKQFPGYSFAGDTSTGMFLEDTDILAFSTAGESRLIIGTTGDVGIGTGVDAATQRLHVVGNARVTGAYYDSTNSAGSNGQVLSSTNSGTTTAWVTPSGGGGGIGGATVTNQVAFGAASSTTDITSNSTFTFIKTGTGSSANTLLEVGDGDSSDDTSKGSVFITAKQVDDSTSRARFQLYSENDLRGYLQCSGTSTDVTLLSNANLVLSGGTKVTIDGGSTSDIVIASASGSNVGIGTTSPQSKLQVDGGIQMGTDGAAANIAAKAGTLRYIEDEVAGAGNSNSYVQMYMRTGASTYDWTTIIRNNW